MRIALVAPLVTTIKEPFVGGSQALVAELARGLVRRQHDVTLFARTGSSVPGVKLETLDVPDSVQPSLFFDQPPSDSSGDPGLLAQGNIFLDLFLRLRQSAFDIIHAHAFDWPSFVCSALIHDRPILHTLHLPAISQEINQALHTLHQHGHPLTLLTVSHACAHSYAAYTPCDAVIYNGLDYTNIPFAPFVAHDAPLLYAGRITPEKGVEDAIAIASHAGRHLLIAGGIYDQSYYEMRIVPLLETMEQHVTYLGQMEHIELWQLMGKARGLLFPIAWDEPFGLTMVEAMATGTPVIAYDRGAAREIVRHGKTGFLVLPGPGASEQAAAHVAQLADLSRADCRAHVEQHFSFEHMLDEHEQLYMKLVRAG